VSIDYDCSADASMSVSECKELLMREMGLWISKQRPDLWLVNECTTVVVQEGSKVFGGARVQREVYGFTPRLVITMRPTLSASYYDQSMQTVMRTVHLMLCNTEGDLGFSYECERLLLLRRDRKVVVRDNYLEHINQEQLSYITVPYQFGRLVP
jgi:hypothetical protein